jgi:MYXO-CTERM domain-containing protein
MALALTLAAGPAWAQTPKPQGSSLTELVDSMMGELDAKLDALDTNNCGAACEAIASMRRAAERICELEPGPRCDAARAKVEGARKKVLAACPSCAAASGKATTVTGEPEPKPKPSPAKKQEQKDAKPSLDLDNEQERATRPAEPSRPPPAAPSDGGCAPCAVGTSSEPGARAAWLMLLGAVIAWRRRRRC